MDKDNNAASTKAARMRFVRAAEIGRWFQTICWVNIPIIGFIYLLVFFVCKDDLIVLNINLTDSIFFRHRHKGSVINLFDLPLGNQRYGNQVKEQYYQQYNAVIEYERFFRFFYFIHNYILLKLGQQRCINS